MCSLFERILVDEMNYYLYHNHLITDAQYGFVMERSTELQLLNCSSVWVKFNAIDAKCFVDIAYIDFAKAFDTVSHTKLLYKLSKYGISGNILKWFTSFLSNRKQRVKIGDAYSDYVDITSGVPQGSRSGPLLFILFANDLPDNLVHTNSEVYMFADDTKIFTVLSDVPERSRMQECLIILLHGPIIGNCRLLKINAAYLP